MRGEDWRKGSIVVREQESGCVGDRVCCGGEMRRKNQDGKNKIYEVVGSKSQCGGVGREKKSYNGI